MVRFLWRLLGGPVVAQEARRIRAATRTFAARRARLTDGAPEDPGGFARAVQDYGLTDADLRRLHRQHTRRFYALTAAALFTLAFSVTTAGLTGGAPWGLLAFGLALWLLAAAAASSLRAWQIRERRLGAFGEWAHQPRAWCPPIFW